MESLVINEGQITKWLHSGLRARKAFTDRERNMKFRYIWILAGCLVLLSGCSSMRLQADTTESVQPMEATTQETEAETTQATTQEATQTTGPLTGWVTENAQTCFLYEDGTRHTGWLELDGKRYYLDERGVLQTGWLEWEDALYYLQEDGSATKGKANIDGQTHFFTSTGAEIMVANPWNIIPEDYSANLVDAENGYKVDAACKDSLLAMLQDCRKDGYNAQITSAYREHELQIYLYDRKVNYFLDLGYSEADAKAEAATIVAVPGTSEHELGLAVDLVDNSYWLLDEAQENTPAQKWLMEHCWEYGFVLRYPNDKSHVTGIIYEPWHYRYVGQAVAQELYESGMCLEEYLDSFTS